MTDYCWKHGDPSTINIPCKYINEKKSRKKYKALSMSMMLFLSTYRKLLLCTSWTQMLLYQVIQSIIKQFLMPCWHQIIFKFVWVHFAMSICIAFDKYWEQTLALLCHTRIKRFLKLRKTEENVPGYSCAGRTWSVLGKRLDKSSLCFSSTEDLGANITTAYALWCQCLDVLNVTFDVAVRWKASCSYESEVGV